MTGAPQTAQPVALTQRAGTLAELIETRLLGVAPDDQDLALEDDDWRTILEALSLYGKGGSEKDSGCSRDHAPATGGSCEAIECHGLDTPERVCFYEQDFYVLSNFSAFAVEWSGFVFPTSEHLYHWLRFTLSEDPRGQTIASLVHKARSAHDAFKIAQDCKSHQISDWDQRKIGTMKRVLRAKVDQHEYVRRKLLATGDRELVENSWRDDFWGWGPNGDGLNMLGKLWMELRTELRAAEPTTSMAEGRS